MSGLFQQHMGSSNVSEDGASERVRFDNIVYYSMDEAIEKVCKEERKKTHFVSHSSITDDL